MSKFNLQQLNLYQTVHILLNMKCTFLFHQYFGLVFVFEVVKEILYHFYNLSFKINVLLRNFRDINIVKNYCHLRNLSKAVLF